MSADSWFEQLFGFPEGAYEETRRRFRVEGDRLRSLVNDRSFAVGAFEAPTLAALRERTGVGHPRSDGGVAAPGRLRVTHEAVGDALELHALPENRGALFQVASQFNCLEFPDPDTTPEDGVTAYASDPTQGPACALAAAAATVWRHAFLPVGGGTGQTRDRQLDNLAELGAALGAPGEFFRVRNGYTSSTAERLAALADRLRRADRDELLGRVAVGVQHDVGVTFASRFVEAEPGITVSQAFCSAVSCAYSSVPREAWQPLARLVLDATYEATLHLALLNAARAGGSPRVWLTFLGGGVFGNDPGWIAAALGRALRLFDGADLDVRIAHHRRVDEERRALLDAARAG